MNKVGVIIFLILWMQKRHTRWLRNLSKGIQLESDIVISKSDCVAESILLIIMLILLHDFEKVTFELRPQLSK